MSRERRPEAKEPAHLGRLERAAKRTGRRLKLRRALTATLKPSNLLHNHSICHGDLGNAEAALAAARALGNDEAAQRAAAIAATAVSDIENRDWRCGVPRGVETPGLMSGLAGIGYALLRWADPAGVPSVLLLEPPTDHRGAIDLP